MDRDDVIMGLSITGVLLVVALLVLFLIPFFAMIVEWAITGVLGKEIEPTWYWTAVCVIEVYTLAKAFVLCSNKEDD